MYRIGKKYKFEIKNKIFYTGFVLDEDTKQLKINTIRDEEIILNKDSIVQSRLEKNSIGDGNGQG